MADTKTYMEKSNVPQIHGKTAKVKNGNGKLGNRKILQRKIRGWKKSNKKLLSEITAMEKRQQKMATGKIGNK